MSKKVIIIGGNGAGLSAASQIKKLKPQWEAIVLEKGPYISYASCGIPYYIAGLVPELQDLFHLSPAQLAGPVEAVKRIDVFASAIHSGMTLGELFHLDLSYSPPYSGVFDPVLLAARVGKKYITK